MKPTCRWVLVPYSKNKTAVFCGKPVKYRVVRDDDGNKKRFYFTFCEEHAAMIAANPPTDEDPDAELTKRS